MSKFTLKDFNIKEEPKQVGEMKIKFIDQPQKPQIKNFEIPTLENKQSDQYSKVKAKYGPLSTMDPDRNTRTQKDRRFSLNPLLRDPLSIEQEERRIMEEKVRARIQTLAEQAQEKAKEEGYKKGLEQGYQEAYKKFQGEALERMKSFDKMIEASENAKRDIFQANEHFFIELLYRIGRMIILKELSTDQQYVLRLAKELIGKVGTRENITIRISPEEAATIGMLKDGLEKAYGNLTNLNIEASNQVSRGGCQVVTEWNEIDARIDVQLQGVYDSLLGKKASEVI